ncbi:hypothetical protein AKG34_08705 [Peribacillus butanolivorans]|nr:hypothetical protein AKG34_08705 [Peribacillus butanolivorans]
MNNLKIPIYSIKSYVMVGLYIRTLFNNDSYYVIHLKDIKNKKALILNKNKKGGTYLKIFETLYF